MNRKPQRGDSFHVNKSGDPRNGKIGVCLNVAGTKCTIRFLNGTATYDLKDLTFAPDEDDYNEYKSLKKESSDNVSPAQLKQLRDVWNNTGVISVTSPAYKKAVELLSKLNIEAIRAVANAEIKVLSTLAKRRIQMGSTEFKKAYIKEGNDLYFNSFTDCADSARKYAEKKGYEIDEESWQTEVALGGRYGRSRPAIGKTHSFSVRLIKNDKPQRKGLHFSVYGMESGKFELTTYIN